MATPNTGAPEWAANHETPWLGWNKAARLMDAFAFRTTVIDRDLTAPPGSCADGARYQVAAGATGAWADKDGQLAIAYGANAANGWIFVPLEIEGMVLKIDDEALELTYRAGSWQIAPAPITRLQDLTDVDMTGVADGYTLRWDQSNGYWFVSPDAGNGNVASGTFRGALVYKGTDQTAANYSSITAITYDTEAYDTDGFHSTSVNTDQFTIPAGISKVRLSAGIYVTLGTASAVAYLAIQKGGAVTGWVGQAGASRGVNSAAVILNTYTPVIEVVEGDTFNTTFFYGDTSVTVEALRTWFAIEVIE